MDLEEVYMTTKLAGEATFFLPFNIDVYKRQVVQGNPRVYKALRDQLAAVLDELHRIEAGQGVNEELLDTIQMITTIMKGMQEDFAYDR